MAMARPDEVELDRPAIDALRRGDRRVFEQFVRRHQRWVRGIVFGVLGDRDAVDDVTQQVWATVWQRIEELRDPDRWRAWLYRLARNAALDAGRERTRRRQAANRSVEAAGSPHADGAGGLLNHEQRRAVMDAIQSLPALYREPFVLRHLSGWSYQQIGEVLELPVDTVETRLVRARRFLRASLEGTLGA